MNNHIKIEITNLLEQLKEDHASSEALIAYNYLRTQILQEILFTDLSLTKLLKTLCAIYNEDFAIFELVLVCFTYPTLSQREVGKKLGLSSSTVCRRLAAASYKYPTIKLLCHLRKVEQKRRQAMIIEAGQK